MKQETDNECKVRILSDMAHSLKWSGELLSVQLRKPKTDPHLEAKGRLGERVIIRIDV